jgi:membrane protease YdiL (CAAX protease family)
MTEVPRSRLVGWTILVTALALLSYAANLADTGDTPDDLLYRWSSAIGGLVQYAIILGIVLAIARGIAPATLGLVRPASWAGAAGRVATALVSIWVIGAVLNVFLQAGKEQGLVPDAWDSGRAAPFVANFLVVAMVAPIVEELTYRGLGFAAVRDAFGNGAAVGVTALAFGLAHGLFVALPVLTIFGLILAWVRLKTGSIYPTIALHALFNGIALIAAVTV